jgi:LPS-assembly protein
MRLRTLIAWAFCMVAATPVLASTGLYLEQDEQSPATKVTMPKQDSNAPVALSANEMGMDSEHGVYIARGNVEAMQGEMILTAQQITYYQQRDLVVAEGDVSVLQPSGDVFFAEKAELKDAMKRAVISEFKARLSDNSVLVADKAVKVNSNVTRLSHASYTPCNLCKGESPFWQMNAKEAEIDGIEERVTYRGAFMEMFGVPVLYTPYLSHPTPDATGKSGFLAPVYSTNGYFGAAAKVPYYWRIDEDKDVVITPWMTTTEGPLLQWDYTQLRDAGDYRVRGSVTYPERRDSAGNEIGSNELRWHLFAQGDEKIADDTHAGFDIQRASDDTYMRRYRFGDQQVLFSRAYVEAAQGRNFALAEGLAIQGLRSSDTGKSTPLVLPILRANYESEPFDNGARLTLSADAQWLGREDGIDQRRFSVTPGVTLPLVTDGGHILTATARVRQDVYDVENVTLNSGANFDGTTARTLPQAALEWRYPLINQFAQGAWLLEPVMLGVLQANGGNPEEISNEDSRLLEINDTNLFSLDRMPGLDLFDSGPRLAYGFRTHYYDNSGVGLDGMLGQNYNFNSDTPFPNSTREGDQFSDYIGRLAVNYMPINLSYRFAVDTQDAKFNRNEIGLGFTEPWLSFYGSYRSIKNNRYLPDSTEGLVNATLPVTDEWSLFGGARRDIELDQMVTANGGVIYKNECFNIMLEAMRVYTRDRDIEPTTEFTFRVAFKNLGEFGGK